ncbi:hypothetical protein G6F68_019298 [Rhizopus microsporus]|nr:hypothetical protein G6F68_019298 [Rhizopus microsporus]
MTLFQRASSRSTNARASAGLLPTGVMPSFSSPARKAGAAGTSRPAASVVQEVTVRPGSPASAAVDTSGRAGERVAPVIARALSLLAWM